MVHMTSWLNVKYDDLGLIDYQAALKLMLDLREKRQKNLIDDTILFLEHSAVITSGRQNAVDDLLISKTHLNSRGIDYQITDRGGRLTFHGPGQLVLYFIINMAQRGWSVDDLVCKSLGLIQEYLTSLGVNASYDKENPGLWVKDKKIASVGFHIQKGVTTHGISFNVCNDLSVYDLFIPCGIQDKGVTNLEMELNKKITVSEVKNSLIKYLSL